MLNLGFTPSVARYDFKKQLRSFGYAWQGIRSCVGKEQNLSFHLIAMTAVTLAGFVLGITRTEWTVVILCFGVVIAAELFNTAIERLVDLVSPERHPIAGQVKDIAAGAVLVCAVAAAIIGLIIFRIKTLRNKGGEDAVLDMGNVEFYFRIVK